MQWLGYTVAWLCSGLVICSGLDICNPACIVEGYHTSIFAKVKIEHG